MFYIEARTFGYFYKFLPSKRFHLCHRTTVKKYQVTEVITFLYERTFRIFEKLRLQGMNHTGAKKLL